ncbi:redoxin domain-containing protein [Aquihabitans sp. G128]|uniref:redoxin domain-containing protein n=1 Tax=Aquihabitans sp. G128 TaxID=2849779 RepID=UPI001C238A36|nr:redoxin domain-containing protein [Aquihabitans sp. G128]QXC61831.1 redoxin domain-containing protein [Aquihabitans sp. G128]
MAVTAGDPAPTFRLWGVHDGARREYTLEEFAGRPVVLITYPGDNTPVCTRQLNAYTGDIDRFLDLDAQLLAVSPEDLDSHQGFSDHQGGFAFPLLADVDKSLARDYGVLGPVGFYRRCVFVIDGQGRLAHVHRGFAGATFRKTPELLHAVEQARARA